MRPYRFVVCVFFFFQAEDGIRDIGVTGVQTCALPIWVSSLEDGERPPPERFEVPEPTAALVNHVHDRGGRVVAVGTTVVRRSEERRVGKECRSRWSPYH